MELKLTKYQKMANYVIFLNYVKARLAIFELSDPDSVSHDTKKPKFHKFSNQWKILKCKVKCKVKIIPQDAEMIEKSHQWTYSDGYPSNDAY